MKRIAVVLLMLILTVGLLPCPVMAAGRTYYVDSEQGNDNNNGLTTIGAWKSLSKLNTVTFSPGDKIMLKAGSAWYDSYLKPSGSGTKENPIVIDSYGEGTPPAIHTNGKASAAISLLYVEGWEIKNVELTNYSSETGRYRRGVYVETGDSDARTYFRFQNLYIHDINGVTSDHNNGGIIMRGYSQRGKAAAFHDVVIENCVIKDTDRNGIRIASENSRDCTGIVIRGNFVDTIGGDGIVTVGAKGAVIEYNTAKDCFYQYQQMAGAACVAIWTYKSDDTLIQYNEAYNTHCTRDGEGFDSDYNCTGSVFQYNYSHDNEGGFMLICNNPSQTGSFNTGTVVRYNISQNDRGSGVMLSGNPTDAKIYNNTIYIKEGLATNPVNTYNWNGGWADRIYFANNIFYNMGEGYYDMGEVTKCVFENNLFYSKYPEREPEDLKKIQTDPKFCGEGTAGIGRESVQGYRLLSGSPCIGAGIILGDVQEDYFGTVLPGQKRDLGAAQYVPGFYISDGPRFIPLKIINGQGQEIQVPPRGETVTLQAEVPEGTHFSAAYYDGAGTLKHLWMEENVQTLEILIENEDGGSLKVFLWENCAGIKPMAEAVTFVFP